ncbi:MAG: MBL fold metallo-hydrolase [Balneolaceae bacterium]|nr:MAG: MBL fold metallo-hydrolase [Balneolaceae bacterium]
MSEPVNIHFLGAAGTVTGSKYLLELPQKKILVDCGMFQGLKELRELNWQQLPVEASAIDLVLLTHGHLDHCGFLPRLVNMGFTGEVWGTAPTLEITEIILRDSAKIQEEDAERANKEKYTKHNPAKPLYSTDDVDRTVTRFREKEEGAWIDLCEDVSVRFMYNGHILGATFIEIKAEEKQIVFSGDIGRQDDPVLKNPKKPQKADLLILESTYGNRSHTDENTRQKLENVINETVQKNGTVIIPSFAVERAQLLMYMLWQLHVEGSLPSNLPVILDTPMGANVLEVFRKHHKWHKLSEKDCEAMCRRVQIVQSFKETWEIIDDPSPKIVIAGSGMVTGGRVLSYLKKYISLPLTTVLFAGYQALGTRGRSLLDGASESKFFGKYHSVKARIEILQGLSGHADQEELLNWISDLEKKPETTFLVHGEPHSLENLKKKLNSELGIKSIIPALFEIFEV